VKPWVLSPGLERERERERDRERERETERQRNTMEAVDRRIS
jgi:hypothetical protein